MCEGRLALPLIWPLVSAYGADDKNADPVTGADDGCLYLMKTNDRGGGTFRHLVGNVAEYVKDASDSVKVVGGSAWSSPVQWSGSGTKSFDMPLDVQATEYGYCDVGFRLAFDAPGEPIGVKIRKVLNKPTWYDPTASPAPSDAADD